jgi:2-methylisocitrate lyase-like PEP mutase family enzyme
MSLVDTAAGGLNPRPTWKQLLSNHSPLILPAAHDSLTARLIEMAGFKAYQVGGFALAGARYAFPDVDLIHFYEENEAIRQIISTSQLPVLADCGDGFGDVKNVIRTVRGYEELGVDALFIEDQKSPIRCGQMGSKEVIPLDAMIAKVKAASSARRNEDTFLLIRTDARASEGVEGAVKRGVAYRDSGADGIYVEGLKSANELKKAGKELKGVPLATTMMEGGGKLAWLSPRQIHDYGFSMILYPTTVLFRVTHAIQGALDDLVKGKPMEKKKAVDLDTFEEIVQLNEWKKIEKKFQS